MYLFIYLYVFAYYDMCIYIYIHTVYIKNGNMHNMRSDFLACFVWTWKTTEETVEIKTNDGLFAMVFHIYVSLHEDKIVLESAPNMLLMKTW